jgi:hypothetical protein
MLMDMPSFDTLKDLAEHDPDAFETLRTELIESFIRASPARHQRRLRGLQFVIDSRRNLASNPMQALIEIQSMMHDCLAKLNQALNGQPVTTCRGRGPSADPGRNGEGRKSKRPKVTPIGTNAR